MDIRKEIRLTMKEKGIRTTEVARRIGKSKQNVWNALNGDKESAHTRNPSIGILREICEAIGAELYIEPTAEERPEGKIQMGELDDFPLDAANTLCKKLGCELKLKKNSIF